MHINNDNYYSFPAISNSTLGDFDNYFKPEKFIADLQYFYDMGNLVDAIITEPHRVNVWNKTVVGIDRLFTDSEINQAKEMKKAFLKDSFCSQIIKICTFQKISYNEQFKINYDKYEFHLPAKCKWDLFCPTADIGGDIKSTFAENYKQFVEACHHFNYFRSRAFYMDLENRTNDTIIGISKKNYKIFIIKIRKGDDLYNLGKKQYQDIAFRYNLFFGDLNNLKTV